MIAVEVLVDKLNSFQSPQEIADFFKGIGIKGNPGETRSCVISNWIMQESEEEFVTTSTAIKVWNGYYEDDDNLKAKYYTSESVCNFITRFDNQHYPELVEDPYEIPYVLPAFETIKIG